MTSHSLCSPLDRVFGAEVGNIGVQLQNLVLVGADGVLDLVPEKIGMILA